MAYSISKIFRGGMCQVAMVMCLAVNSEAATPNGPVVLTVTGQIGSTRDSMLQFDMEDLRQLPVSVVETSTLWTDGVQEFRGVLLADLLEHLEARGNLIRFWAVNEYSVDVPVSDAIQGGPIIAYELNGSPMSLRDKGPLWLVYPYDSDVAYQTEVIYARSIWQLDRIAVIDQ